MTKCAPFCPLQPDEAIAGYLGRLAMRLGLDLRLSDIRPRLRKRIAELDPKYDANLIAIIEKFSNKEQSEIIEYHSIFPFKVAFSAYENQFEELFRGLELSDQVATALFFRHKACSECVRNDIRELGFTYWRRIHQIPGSRFCPHHRVRLFLPPSRHAYNFQPHHLLANSENVAAKDESVSEFEVRMIQIWTGILSMRRSLPIVHAQQVC